MPPTTSESLPPIRTRKGEKYVDVPPPVLARPPGAGSSYWNVREVGTAVIAKVPA